MGGVDLMNRLIKFYRIDIRSKKWPLKLTFHAVDFAVTNAWLEYRKDCKTLKVPKKNILDLLAFRMQLAKALTTVGKTVGTRKRGHPSIDDENNAQNHRGRNEKGPTKEIKLDAVDHLPVHDDKAEPTRCKMKTVASFDHTGNARNALTKTRNCFSLFHNETQ